MKLSDALRKYADDLDTGRPLVASALTIVAVDAAGRCNAAYFGPVGPNTPMRDVGIGMCAMGIERFLTGMTPSGRPLQAGRAST